MNLDLFKSLPLKDIYNDLLSPSMKNAGAAIGHIVEFASIPTLYLSLFNERHKTRIKKHLDNFSRRLEEKNIEEIIPVQDYIGIPILESLNKIEESALSQTFVNLLLSSSQKSYQQFVHPSHLQTLKNISVDEANLLFECQNKESIPYVSFQIRRGKQIIKPNHFGEKRSKTIEEIKEGIEYTFRNASAVYIPVYTRLTGLEKNFKLLFPDNINLYLENLNHNGLIDFDEKLIKNEDENQYNFLEQELYKDLYDQLNMICNEQEEKDLSVHVIKGRILFTELGISFLNACVKPSKI